MDEDKIEELAKTFHEIYFTKLWTRAGEEGRVTSSYDPDRDSWESFNSLHKEALRYTIYELLEKKMIYMDGVNLFRSKSL